MLNQIFNFILSFVQKKLNGKTIAEALQAHRTKPKTWQQKHKEFMFLFNVRFNQRKSKIDPVFRAGNGIQSAVESAQEMVKADASLMPNKTKRKRFLKQSAKGVSKYLCNTIVKYVDLCGFRKMPSIELFIIKGVNDDGLLWAGGNYSKQVERNLMKPYCNYKASLRFDYALKKGFSPLEMINEFIDDKNWEEACIRIQTGSKRWQGHTFRIVKNGKDIIMYDQYHNHWSGIDLQKRRCKITNVYKFVKK